MEKTDYEKGLALYALNYAKDLIDFLYKSNPYTLKPPLKPIDDVITMIETGKLPWEK